MRISLLRISLLRFFKTITKIWLMQFFGLFVLLLRTSDKNLAKAIFSLELKPNNHIYTSVHVTRENIHLSQTDSTLF